MTVRRRQFLHLAAGAAVVSAVPRIARSQGYPTRPVRIMVGFPPGGAYDTLARPMGQWLSERLRQPFIIENRPGAGSNLATEAVARAASDGYTLLMIGPTQVMNITLYDARNFDFLRDVVPIDGITLAPLAMVVNPSFPARTVPEFIAYAKANPSKVNMASSGNGVINHIVGELFRMVTGIDMVHVPYRGGAPALTDLLGGQVQMMFATISSSIEYIRSGKLRVLAVTTARRSEALPDVSTVAETVSGFEANDWYGIGATKGTPPEIIEKLNTEINAALADTRMKERLAVLGGVPMPTTPTDFGKLMANEAEKWGKVIRAAKQALGTKSSDFVNASLIQLQAAARLPCSGISEIALNAALALIEAAAPRDELEGALAIQMACTHTAAMAVLARLGGGHGTERRVASLASAAARLLRAYSAQVEVFRRLRHGGQQLVRVEHVHIHEGGQAIIGNVKPVTKHSAGDGE